ncbi:DNA translocase FtsK [Serratia aquatilis]|uniref:DNA translocase FtsK n=1 Tax=Serratia aquatilis TaxID=1737515 RepID=A0ABV6E7W3_9GAMM
MLTELNKDPLYDQALNLIINRKLKNDIKAVQHHFRIGYNRAANFVQRIRQDNISLNKDR